MRKGRRTALECPSLNLNQIVSFIGHLVAGGWFSKQKKLALVGGASSNVIELIDSVGSPFVSTSFGFSIIGRPKKSRFT